MYMGSHNIFKVGRRIRKWWTILFELMSCYYLWVKWGKSSSFKLNCKMDELRVTDGDPFKMINLFKYV